MRACPTLLITLALVLSTSSAHAVVPGEVNYQGLLLDSLGSPVTGNEDFVFSLFDVASGGAAVWTENHDAVPVLDGVYDVVLGSTTPITPGLIAGGDLYLEISVGGETLTPRQRLLAVPYALSAESAESVDGLSGVFVTQLFEHVNFDGQDPPNLDPSEGTDDVDGDGIANFVDPDNDGDGIEDQDELAQGSDINLVTPVLTSFDPLSADANATTTVTVSGQNFLPGLAVAFGTENPAPQNLTLTSFDVDVGPQPQGAASVVVTNPNAESDSGSYTFEVAMISSLVPALGDANSSNLVTINGSGFTAGVQVSFGSENPVPQNVTSTSFDVTVGPQTAGAATVEVNNPGGPVVTASFEFVDATLFRKVFVTSTTTDGDMGGVAGADAICASLASTASLPGTFLAWIGDATTDPATRFSQGAGYELVNGNDVASSFTDLSDGVIMTQINRDENDVAQAFSTVWTGVDGDGTTVTTANDVCAGWTSGLAGSSAVYGNNNLVASGWTFNAIGACSVSRRLYCFEQ